jgi:general stress protein 26
MIGSKEASSMYSTKRRRQVSYGGGECFSDREQRIYDFLIDNPTGVLSTASPDCEPHGVVVYFTIDKQFIVFFLTRTGTRKYDNLTHNNHVMLTVFEPHTRTTVQLAGKATELHDRSAINAVAGSVTAIGHKTSDVGLLPIMRLSAGDFTAFRIDPVQIRMARYAEPDSGDYRDLFDSVESFDLE